MAPRTIEGGKKMTPMPDHAVFERFFGRKPTGMPIIDSLDDEQYYKLFNQYANSLGWGCITTKKGFAEWLVKQTK